MTSLRDRLRADTAPRHACVDRAYSSLDLTQPECLRAFLRTQLSVLVSVRCRPGRHAAAATELGFHMTAALTADLRNMQGRPAAPVGVYLLDATAVLYMLLGSSLGTRVLRRRWLEATDPTVRTAGRYLGLEPPQGAWRALCEELVQRPAEGAVAERTVRDAMKIFDLHLAALAGRTFLPKGAAHA